MGQYYRIALIKEDEVKVIRPDWIKLMEHARYGNKSMQRVEKILSEWHYRPLWIWDYCQAAPFLWCYEWFEEEDCFYNTEEDWERNWILKREEWKVYYLVNHTRKQFIDMWRQEKKYKDDYWYCVHPLALLCRVDTEEAGWDYHSQFPNFNKQGIWAGDEIWVSVYDWERLEEFKYFDYKDVTDILYFREKEEWVEKK